MAEKKRRSDVKKFKQATQYPSRPVQLTLFGDVLLNSGQSWKCSVIGTIAPPVGATVLVRFGADKGPQVLWGNEYIATLCDIAENALSETISYSEEPNRVVAATVTSDESAFRRFAIQFLQEVR